MYFDGTQVYMVVACSFAAFGSSYAPAASLPSDCGFSSSKIVVVAVVDWEAARERIHFMAYFDSPTGL